jgi:hypothetical protein
VIIGIKLLANYLCGYWYWHEISSASDTSDATSAVYHTPLSRCQQHLSHRWFACFVWQLWNCLRWCQCQIIVVWVTTKMVSVVSETSLMSFQFFLRNPSCCISSGSDTADSCSFSNIL